MLGKYGLFRIYSVAMVKGIDEIRRALKSGADIKTRSGLTRHQLIRALLMLINDPDEYVRQKACWCLGSVVAQLERAKKEDFLRRLLWRINPESGDNPHGVPEAIGEIGARSTHEVRPFVPVLALYADDQKLLPGILQALGRIGQQEPQIVEEHLQIIFSALKSEVAAIFGNAALALLRISGTRGDENMILFSDDCRRIRFFCENRYHIINLCDLVKWRNRLADSCFVSSEQ
jgi:hypothetical protein